MVKRGRGRPPKHTEKLVPFAARLPEQLHGQLKAIAVEKNVSMNDLLVKATQQWVARIKR